MVALPRTVLFLCTGNSARSLMAEALLNARGAGRFRAYSAGSRPTGRPHPLALAVLRENGVPTTGLRSKSWEEFARPAAPRFDLVVTVCDHAAREACPVWPGAPARAHWGIPDPAAAEGSEEARGEAFRAAFALLSERISALLTLPLERLDRAALERALAEIGRGGGRGGVPAS